MKTETERNLAIVGVLVAVGVVIWLLTRSGATGTSNTGSLPGLSSSGGSGDTYAPATYNIGSPGSSGIFSPAAPISFTFPESPTVAPYVPTFPGSTNGDGGVTSSCGCSSPQPGVNSYSGTPATQAASLAAPVIAAGFGVTKAVAALPGQGIRGIAMLVSGSNLDRTADAYTSLWGGSIGRA